MRRGLVVFASMVLVGVLAGPAHAVHNDDEHSDNMSVLFESPNATGAINEPRRGVHDC